MSEQTTTTQPTPMLKLLCEAYLNAPSAVERELEVLKSIRQTRNLHVDDHTLPERYEAHRAKLLAASTLMVTGKGPQGQEVTPVQMAQVARHIDQMMSVAESMEEDIRVTVRLAQK